jgi:hypothetical protein
VRTVLPWAVAILVAALAGAAVGFGAGLGALAVARSLRPAPHPAPAVFCPAGQRAMGTASGWPVCVADH